VFFGWEQITMVFINLMETPLINLYLQLINQTNIAKIS
jgi:hypothetical protein